MKVSIWTAIFFIIAMYALGLTEGYYAFARIPVKVVSVKEHRLQCYCFNGSTWDRCRAGTDGTLFDAHGEVSQATIRIPETEEPR